MIRFAVIGTNWITRQFVEAAHESGKYKLTAVYSRSLEQAQHFANDFSVQVYNNKADYKKKSLFFSIFLAILGGVATYYFSGRSLKPLKEFSEKIEEVEARNLSDSRIEENKVKELNQLSISYNKMLDRLSESFEMQRQFTANAAHELRTPLAVMQAQLDLYHTTSAAITRMKTMVFR